MSSKDTPETENKTLKLQQNSWMAVAQALSAEGWSEGSTDTYVASCIIRDKLMPLEIPPAKHRDMKEEERIAAVQKQHSVAFNEAEMLIVKKAVKARIDRKPGGSIAMAEIMPAFGLV